MSVDGWRMGPYILIARLVDIFARVFITASVEALSGVMSVPDRLIDLAVSQRRHFSRCEIFLSSGVVHAQFSSSANHHICALRLPGGRS